MKRLAIFCDGTWNRPDQLSRGVAAPTNVAKLALAVADRDAENNPQRVHYQVGVGTRRWERLRGGALGIGLSRNVLDCYRFLIENYEPEDRLYFFGFSRGAYTARSLVGLVRNSGILRPQNDDKIKDAYALYRRPLEDKDSLPSGVAAELFRRTYSHPDVEIQMVGVWDTVGALGIPTDVVRLPFLTKRWTFHDARLSRKVLHACHAIAIDERRKAFQPTLWEQTDPVEGHTLEQVWFAGVHCDVGGGYADTGLSEIPLLWMAGKASEYGLALREDRLGPRSASSADDDRREGKVVAPDPLGEKHESRTKFYLLMPAYDRGLAGDNGADVDGCSLASSAKTRYEKDSDYRPKGLREWVDGDRDVTQVPVDR